jgi:hypothetical protein
VISRFNNNQAIDRKLTQEIEDFLYLIWEKDKTQALKVSEDRMIYRELPHTIRYKIYTDFLFYDFLKTFKFLFKIKKPDYSFKNLNRNKKKNNKREATNIIKMNILALITFNNFFGWKDAEYADFMIQLLDILEPRVLEPS